MKEIIKQQRMTSLEIAEVTGKQHKDVMRAIRNMEPAWKKANGRNFALVEYRDKKGELRPCYSLTKTECLYVATKFNDEARARLVLRWEELEQERLQQKPAGLTDMQIMCLAVKIQQRTIEEQHKKIDKLRPDADYCNEVLESVSCFTTTQIAKELSMTVHDLTRLLMERKVMYKQSGQYMLFADYARKGYAKSRTHSRYDAEGEMHTSTYLVWTERGRRFVHRLCKGEEIVIPLFVEIEKLEN